MPKIQFGAGAYVNEAYGLPQIILENWFAQAADDRPDWGYRLVPTPGLVSFSDHAEAIGRGCFQSDAIAAGEIIQVFGTQVRRVNSAGVSALIAGSVLSDDMPVSFASSQTQLVMVSGGNVYTVTESLINDFTPNLTAAGASGDIIDVAVLSNRHLYVEDGSGRLFYSAPGDATNIDGFITAESDPDQLFGVLVVAAQAILFGTQRIEFWISTTSTTTPLIPRQGFVLDVGVMSTHAKCELKGIAYWVGNNGVLYRWAGGREERISSHWLERVLGGLSEADKALVRVTPHSYHAHEFVKIFVPGYGDYFYDGISREFHRRKALGNDEKFWGYDYFVEAFGKTYAQQLTTGRLYHLDADVSTENGVNVRRVSTALAPVSSDTPIKNLVIEGQAGIGLDQDAGEGADPQCMLRVAYDSRVFKHEWRRTIGKLGQYRWRTVFGPLGTIRPPLVAVELSYADPVGWTVYGATYNERAS